MGRQQNKKVLDQKTKHKKLHNRHKRLRKKVFGTAVKPRFSVFRSSKHIYVKLIDDDRGHVLVSVSDLSLNLKIKISEKNSKVDKDQSGRGKIAAAYEVGKLAAEKALKNKITQAVFDRGGYKYHGRVKAVAEGAREGGLKF